MDINDMIKSFEENNLGSIHERYVDYNNRVLTTEVLNNIDNLSDIALTEYVSHIMSYTTEYKNSIDKVMETLRDRHKYFDATWENAYYHPYYADFEIESVKKRFLSFYSIDESAMNDIIKSTTVNDNYDLTIANLFNELDKSTDKIISDTIKYRLLELAWNPAFNIVTYPDNKERILDRLINVYNSKINEYVMIDSTMEARDYINNNSVSSINESYNESNAQIMLAISPEGGYRIYNLSNDTLKEYGDISDRFNVYTFEAGLSKDFPNKSINQYENQMFKIPMNSIPARVAEQYSVSKNYPIYFVAEMASSNDIEKLKPFCKYWHGNVNSNIVDMYRYIIYKY